MSPDQQLVESDVFDLFDDDNPNLKRSRKFVARKCKIFLIDFGLATHYISQNTGMHIQKNKTLKSKTGTACYASINVHKGYCKFFTKTFSLNTYLPTYLQ